MDFFELFEVHLFAQNIQLIKLISHEEDIDYNILLNIIKKLYDKKN
jgi:hypothetical protein